MERSSSSSYCSVTTRTPGCDTAGTREVYKHSVHKLLLAANSSFGACLTHTWGGAADAPAVGAMWGSLICKLLQGSS